MRVEETEIKGKLKKEGLILFSYAISCPDLQEQIEITNHYRRLCEQLQAELESKGEAYGERCLQLYLGQGKKRSRFSPPFYRLINQTVIEENTVRVTLNATMTQGKETLFSKTETHLWDTSYPKPVMKRKK